MDIGIRIGNFVANISVIGISVNFHIGAPLVLTTSLLITVPPIHAELNHTSRITLYTPLEVLKFSTHYNLLVRFIIIYYYFNGQKCNYNKL